MINTTCLIIFLPLINELINKLNDNPISLFTLNLPIKFLAKQQEKNFLNSSWSKNLFETCFLNHVSHVCAAEAGEKFQERFSS